MTSRADTLPDVESPCIRECVIDQQHGYCLGCWRTMDEISFWHRYDPVKKHEVLAQIEIRRAAHATTH